MESRICQRFYKTVALNRFYKTGLESETTVGNPIELLCGVTWHPLTCFGFSGEAS